MSGIIRHFRFHARLSQTCCFLQVRCRVTEKKPKQKEPVETRRKRRIGESSDFLLKKVSEMNMTEEEGNYVKTYIGNVSFGQVNRNGNPIVVREVPSLYPG